MLVTFKHSEDKQDTDINSLPSLMSQNPQELNHQGDLTNLSCLRGIPSGQV